MLVRQSVTVKYTLILHKKCVNLKCVDTLPGEDIPTPSPVATDSRLFSPNFGNTISSPRGTSAIYRTTAIWKVQKSSRNFTLQESQPRSSRQTNVAMALIVPKVFHMSILWLLPYPSECQFNSSIHTHKYYKQLLAPLLSFVVAQVSEGILSCNVDIWNQTNR